MLVFLLAPVLVYGDERYQRVQIVEPYVELRTGPGRAYPIFHIAERGRWVEILKRRTDWFKVRTERDKEGWVSRSQMQNTLTEAGVQKTFRDTLLEDYLRRRVEFGFAGGAFEGDPVMTVRAGLKLTENFLAELSVSQVSGDFSSSLLYYGSLVSQPFPDWRISPFFALGVGKLRSTPRATLVGAIETDSSVANVGIGLRAYVTRRFIVRLDVKDHVVLADENRNEEYKEVSAGFSFFF